MCPFIKNHAALCYYHGDSVCLVFKWNTSPWMSPPPPFTLVFPISRLSSRLKRIEMQMIMFCASREAFWSGDNSAAPPTFIPSVSRFLLRGSARSLSAPVRCPRFNSVMITLVSPRGGGGHQHPSWRGGVRGRVDLELQDGDAFLKNFSAAE